MEAEGRILSHNWDLYDTRHVVYKTRKMSAEKLEAGYWWAYKEFYKWKNIFKAAGQHVHPKHQLKHLAYTGGWKKFEWLWKLLINSGSLRYMLPILEAILSKVPDKSIKSPASLQTHKGLQSLDMP